MVHSIDCLTRDIGALVGENARLRSPSTLGRLSEQRFLAKSPVRSRTRRGSRRQARGVRKKPQTLEGSSRNLNAYFNGVSKKKLVSPLGKL